MRNLLQTLWLVELWLGQVLCVGAHVISFQYRLFVAVRRGQFKSYLFGFKSVDFMPARTDTLPLFFFGQHFDDPGQFSPKVTVFAVVRVDQQGVAVSGIRL